MDSDTNPKPNKNSAPSPTSKTNNTSQQDYPSFSKLLQGVVMAANSTVPTNPLVKDANFQGQFEISHREALASVSAKAAESPMQQCEVEPKSESPSDEPPPSKDCEEKKPSIQHKENVQEADNNKNSSCLALIPLKPADSPPPKPLPVQLTKGRVDKLDVKRGNSFRSDERPDDVPKTPSSDGYGWRKYGQKQVKNSGSSRSYYRCTFYNCIAKKKVQHLDMSGEIIAVVYKGEHNHDPPQHLAGSTRKRDPPLAATPVNEKQLGDPHTPASTTCSKKEVEYAIVPVTRDNGEKNPSTPASLQEKDAGQESITTPAPIQRLTSEEAKATLSAEAEQCKSSKSDECGMKEFDVIPLKKRRIKECGKSIPESVYRTFKEPKVIVHTSGDVGSSDDGYRWRKYGQKMVKGNPNPRSYYRCSTPGCPVRKHVERSTDNSTNVIVTYEGMHDHDKPVPKKVQGHTSPRSPPTIEKPGPKSPPQSQRPSGPQSKDGDSEPKGDSDKKKPGEAGSSDKVLESAGIEIKSC